MIFKKKLTISFKGKQFSLNNSFLELKENNGTGKIISLLSLLSHFYLCESVFGIRTGTGIRIHKVAEYESNLGSGSSTLI